MNRLSSLQALQTICCSVSSFLGPTERMKCILGDVGEDGHLVSSCCELMCHLDIEHPVGHLAMEACASHQKMHGTGTTTLMTMAGFWAAEIQLLLTQGVPISAIIRYGDECLAQCLDALETITVPCTNFTAPKTQTSSIEAPLAHIEESHKTCTGGDLPFSTSDKPHLPSHKAHSERRVSHRSHDFTQDMGFYESKFHSSTTGHLTVQQQHSVQYPSKRFNSTVDLEEEYFADRPGASSQKIETGNFGSSQTMCQQGIVEQSSIFQLSPSEDEDGFEEVQFNISDSQQPAFLGQMKAKSKADAPVEMNDDEDEVSWFFDTKDEYTLEKHLSDLELLSTGCPARLSLDHSTDTHLNSVDSKDISARYNHSLVGKTRNEQVDEICQLRAEVGGGTSDEESDEFDSCFPPEDEEDTSSRDSVMVKSDDVVDNHQARKPSAIQESIHKLLLAKQDKIAAERTAKVQNNSRHFRTFETVTDQNSSGSEATNSCHGNTSAIESEKVPEQVEHSRRPANQLNASRNRGYNPTSSHVTFPCDVALETTAPQETETPDAVQDLIKVKQKNAAAMRLTNVQNRSRHFNVTPGQSHDPEMTLSVSTGVTEPLLRNNFHEEKMGFLSQEPNGVDVPPSRPQFPLNLDGIEEPDILNLGFGLSHGADMEMKLVVEAFQMQAAHRQLSNTEMMFDLNRISVCTIPGPAASESHLESGVLVKTDNLQLPSIAAASTGGSIRALIVNGDATPNFRHRGFKKATKVKVFTEGTQLSTNPEKSWLGAVIKVLQELNIKLIVLKGRSDEDLLDYCLAKKVILLQDVSYKTLQALGEACSVPLLNYVGDATMNDVACGITIAGLELGWADRARVTSNALQRAVYARILVEGKLLQTGVLSNTVASLVTASEVRFWKSAHRLRDVLQSGRCLPGAGVSEQTAMRRLLRMKDKGLKSDHNTSVSCYREPITSSFSNGFVSYEVQILKNMGRVTDLSHEKSCILHGVRGDSSEPVCTGSIQSDPHQQSESAIPASECTSNSDEKCQGYGPDLTGSSQSDLELTGLGDIITHGSSKCHMTPWNNSPSSTGMDYSNPKTRTQQKLHNKHNFREKLANFEGREVYDSYSAKRAAWEGAWVLLKTALRVDAHIVTGLQESHQQGSSINRINMGRSVIL